MSVIWAAEPAGDYTVGSKALILAHAALRRMGFRPFAEPVLYWLVEETHLAANIGVLEGGRSHCSWIASRVPNTLSGGVQLPKELRDIGIEVMPSFATGLGKECSSRAFEPSQLKGRRSTSRASRKLPHALLSRQAPAGRELERVRERGFASAQGETLCRILVRRRAHRGADGRRGPRYRSRAIPISRSAPT